VKFLPWVRAAAGFIVAILFALVAIWMGRLAWNVFTSGRHDSGLYVVAGFAIVFGLAAIASIARAVFAIGAAEADPRYRGQVWLQNREWSTGKIRGTGSRQFHPELVLHTVPAPIGGALRAHLQFATQPQPGVIRVSLRWLRRNYTGDSQTYNDMTVWEDTKEIAAPGGITLPIEFDIPADAEQSHEIRLQGRVIWRIDIDSPWGEIRYEIPVFRVGEPTRVLSPAASIGEAPLVHTIPVHETTAGLDIAFPARRNLRLAFALLAVAIVWTASAVLAFKFGSIGAGLLLAASDLFLLYRALDGFVGSSRVIVGEKTIAVERHLLGTLSRSIPTADVADVRLSLSGSSGTGRSLRNFYTLEISSKNRRRVTLGKGISNKREGVWLVQKIRQRLGLPLEAQVDFSPMRKADLRRLVS
jgi:hypothetical protein